MIFIFKLNCKKGVQVDIWSKASEVDVSLTETLCLPLILLSIRMTIGTEICSM